MEPKNKMKLWTACLNSSDPSISSFMFEIYSSSFSSAWCRNILFALSMLAFSVSVSENVKRLCFESNISFSDPRALLKSSTPPSVSLPLLMFLDRKVSGMFSSSAISGAAWDCRRTPDRFRRGLFPFPPFPDILFMVNKLKHSLKKPLVRRFFLPFPLLSNHTFKTYPSSSYLFSSFRFCQTFRPFSITCFLLCVLLFSKTFCIKNLTPMYFTPKRQGFYITHRYQLIGLNKAVTFDCKVVIQIDTKFSYFQVR